jgi:hypothetical protein
MSWITYTSIPSSFQRDIDPKSFLTPHNYPRTSADLQVAGETRGTIRTYSRLTPERRAPASSGVSGSGWNSSEGMASIRPSPTLLP